jgi:hypothetical protein
VNKTRLRPRIEFHLERVLVLPRDVDASRLPDDISDAVRLALQSGGFVLREIPRVGGGTRRLIERQVSAPPRQRLAK